MHLSRRTVMFLQVFRFATVLVTALGLSLGVAHTLELPPKMAYDAELYTAVTSTLYRMYGSAGAVLQMGSLVAVAVLCWLVRGSRAFRPTVAALLALVLSLGLWAAIVQPVNAEWGRVLQSDPSAAPAAYLRLRPRWEYGHVAACVAWLAGFACLVLSLLVEIPYQTRAELASAGQERTVSRDDAVTLGRQECERRGWPWLEPVEVRETRRAWQILTNRKAIGCNASIAVEKRTGRVTQAAFAPR
jgi:hypothetical protein